MHYLAYVLIPRDTTDIVGEVSRRMAGGAGQPDKVFPDFTARCGCLNGPARQRAYAAVDETPAGQMAQHALRLARLEDNRALEAELLARRQQALRAHQEADPDYGRPDPACATCQGSGQWRASSDPATHFDWWQIGGRWDGLFADAGDMPPAVDCPLLRGNMARAGALLAREVPVVLITAEGHAWWCWSDGSEPWEQADWRDWTARVRAELERHAGDWVVVVDGHL